MRVLMWRNLCILLIDKLGQHHLFTEDQRSASDTRKHFNWLRILILEKQRNHPALVNLFIILSNLSPIPSDLELLCQIAYVGDLEGFSLDRIQNSQQSKDGA